MKKISFTNMTFLVAWVVSASISYAGNVTNPVDVQLSEAASRRDTGAVIGLLPQIEKLWPGQPQTYFETLQKAATILEPGWRANAGVQGALASTFTNALQKQCSSDAELSCLEGKWNLAMVGINMVIESPQPATLSALAQFLGNVRQRRIPNYTNRGSKVPPDARAILDRAGVFNPSSLKSAEDRAAYERAMEQNRRDLHMNDVQSLLWRIDQALTSRLIQACKQLSSSDGKHKALLNEVATSARLTESERQGF